MNVVICVIYVASYTLGIGGYLYASRRASSRARATLRRALLAHAEDMAALARTAAPDLLCGCKQCIADFGKRENSQ